jgi:hypothetical protein
MNNNTNPINDNVTVINTEEDVSKELVLAQIEFTDNLDNTNINYLTYLIVG